MKAPQKSKKVSPARRYGAIDIGTNSTRYMVAEKRGSAPLKILEQGGEITRLGRDLHQSGNLKKGPREATLKAVKKFYKRILSYEVDALTLFGTSAMRDAKNGKSFIQEVKKATRETVRILSGQKEAEAAYEGMTAALTKKVMRPVALDIGGGSTEIVFKDKKGKIYKKSLQIGAVRLHEGMEKNLDQALKTCRQKISRMIPLEKTKRRPWVGAGGTITTLAAIDLKLKKYDPKKVHLHKLSIRKIEDLFLRLNALPLSKRKKVVGLEPKRADVIVAGAAILLTLLHLARAEGIIVSDRGILYGSCLKLCRDASAK